MPIKVQNIQSIKSQFESSCLHPEAKQGLPHSNGCFATRLWFNKMTDRYGVLDGFNDCSWSLILGSSFSKKTSFMSIYLCRAKPDAQTTKTAIQMYLTTDLVHLCNSWSSREIRSYYRPSIQLNRPDCSSHHSRPKIGWWCKSQLQPIHIVAGYKSHITVFIWYKQSSLTARRD